MKYSACQSHIALLSLSKFIQGSAMTESSLKSNNVIFCEMMSHPVIFSHSHPKTLGIVGDNENTILNEVLKHSQLVEIQSILTKELEPIFQDDRVKKYDYRNWTKTSHNLDILITLAEPSPDTLQQAFNQLHSDGILLQAAASPFESKPLRLLINQLKVAGFQDLQILHFPQPNYPGGWRMAIIALKTGTFKRLREKNIYNKSFKTQYYNFDIHRASLVLPEFMRETVI
jgi:spermidine synthase